MNRLTEILKRHIWCVMTIAAIILLAITALSFSKDDNLVSHLSLTSAVVSIVLAVIVIVYMYFQDNRSSQNIIEMRNLVDQASRLMVEKAGTMADQAISMEESFRELIETSSKVSGPAMPLKDKTFHFDASEARVPLLLVLYYLIKFHELNKPIHLLSTGAIILKPKVDAEDASEIKELKTHMSYYSAGVFACLKCFWGSECIPKDGPLVEIKEVPKDFQQNILAIINAQIESAEPDNIYRTWLEIGMKKIDALVEAA